MPTKVGIHDFAAINEVVDGRPSPAMTENAWPERQLYRRVALQ
jgi:hypothetical protein